MNTGPNEQDVLWQTAHVSREEYEVSHRNQLVDCHKYFQLNFFKGFSAVHWEEERRIWFRGSKNKWRLSTDLIHQVFFFANIQSTLQMWLQIIGKLQHMNTTAV